MAFTSVGVVLTLFPKEDVETREKSYTSLLESLTGINYLITRINLSENQIEEAEVTLKKTLLTQDVVIALGGFKERTSYIINKAVHTIFTESFECEKRNGVSDVEVDLDFKRYTLLTRDENSKPIARLHRLIIIHDDFNITKASVQPLFQYLDFLQKKPCYNKIYNFVRSPNFKPLLDAIVCSHADLHLDYKVKNDGLRISVQSSSVGNFSAVEDQLSKYFGKALCADYEDDFMDQIFCSNNANVKTAVETIKKCFDTYGPENVFLTFNGGKDSTVLLHLTMAVLKKHFACKNHRLFSMYVKSKSTFSELNEFIESTRIYYNLDVVVITSEIKEALQTVLDERPNLKACLMGTRRRDPFSQQLSHFQMTDTNWPKVMRVFPILDWSYGDVWDYLIEYKVNYCCLYDHGYTSLGNVDNTVKNPELYFYDEKTGTGAYLPAHKLLNGFKERSGRNVNST